jgi:quinol monooxygenase YgiN
VTTDIGNRGTMRYTEEWLTEDDLRRHMLTNTFEQLVTLMEDATQAPHVEFTLANETRGFDFVEEVRGFTR